MTVKTNGSKRALTFGDFTTAAYRAWGTRRAKGFVWPAPKVELLVFRGRQRCVIWEE